MVSLRGFLALLIGAAWWGSASVQAADPRLTELLEPEQVETLTLTDVVLRALENNLDISISRQSRDARITDILFEQAKFDPTVELSGSYDRSVAPLNRPIFGFGGVTVGQEPDNFDQNDTSLKLGFTQKLLTGGTYDLTLDSTRNSVAGQTSFLFNPSYTASLLFNLTQPLLRDFGADVNATQITIAKNAATVEHYVFVDRVLTVIEQVEQAYWELVFVRENETIARAALKAAEALLADNRARVQAGVMAEVEVLQAQAGVADRVEQVLLAQKAIRDQEDQLRRLFAPTEEDLMKTVAVIPVDRPVKTPPPLTLGQEIRTALKARPDVLQAQKNIESSQANTQLAKNQLLPNLAFQGRLGLSGLGKRPGDTFERTFSSDFYNIGGGLVLSYPLGNRSAESRYHRRRLEASQAKASLDLVRRQVIVDVKEAYRRIQTNFKRITTTQTAGRFAERQLRAEQERLRLGLSTTRAVLDLQRDLATAKGKVLRALLDFNQSLSHLRRVTATALDHHHIVLQ